MLHLPLGLLEIQHPAFASTAITSLGPNLPLRIPAGSFLLIQGPSGVGKSTLARLVAGLGTPNVGKVEIDGQPASLTNAGVGTVLQNDRLVSDTIEQNILLYRSGYSKADIEWAVGMACATEFIEQLPMRYATIVSESYSGLSAGQKQRILLARALLGRPRVLVLDEITSHLDQRTESKIMENLSLLDATKVVVSHHSDLAVFADHVLSLGTGAVAKAQVHTSFAAADV